MYITQDYSNLHITVCGNRTLTVLTLYTPSLYETYAILELSSLLLKLYSKFRIVCHVRALFLNLIYMDIYIYL
jgi:UDP-N-acetylmuramoylalanine-D-glutamate ligase